MSSETVVPTSVEDLATALRDTASTHPVVEVRGAGSKSGWGGCAAAADLVIDTRRLDKVVEHAAGDLVVTAGAGISLDSLRDLLATAGQRLALDPPEPGATVGGVVATAASGPLRLRFGTPRDLLIGVTVVLADGTIARSGGKVVKNVAGYDLGKLFTGSFGTLGVVAECTFRLHPSPRAVRVVSIATDDPSAFVRRLLRSPVVASACEWDGARLQVLLEAVEPAAQAQAEQVVALCGSGDISDALPAGFGARPWRDGGIGLKLTHRLSALPDVIDAVREMLPGATLHAHAASGVLYAAVETTTPLAQHALEGLREVVATADGQVAVVTAPRELKQSLDVWGPVRGLAVMRRIKQQFDPDQRMNPGRFVA
jgi:glycolate oxidase FAD binding subunit